MPLAAKLRRAPGRIATGAFILNSGLTKFRADEETAKALHNTAASAFPVLEKIEPKQFLKLLAAGEIALGGALLAPVVPAALAGLGLAGFSSALLTMWWRTPGCTSRAACARPVRAPPSPRTCGCSASARASSSMPLPRGRRATPQTDTRSAPTRFPV